MPEEILEPDLPIVDTHHHLWHSRPHALAKRYMLDELAADAASGHKVAATVFVECTAFYKPDGPAERRSIGQTEAVNGVAAMAASGVHGDFRACAGIIGHVDLRLGERVDEVLQAHVAAGGGRFRGVRNIGGYDEDPKVLPHLHGAEPGLYRREDFGQGVRQLARHGLTFDAWVLEPQLPDVIALARSAPDTTIILDHLGSPVATGRYEGRREERFPIWRANMAELARCENVTVKVGGLGMVFANFPSYLAEPRATSEKLAAEWRPYVETTLELFGAERCMVASNFPGDLAGGSYATLWNAFKRLATGCSADEKGALFSGTAKRVYRLDLP